MGTNQTGQKLGPIGRRAARNLKELRGRVPVRELSHRLASIGRPILPSGITKIEQGDRRVDVDDLVALAVALDVSPNRLLLDPGADDEPISLTDEVEVTCHQSWDWATGAEPLPRQEDEVQRGGHINLDRLGSFQDANRPNEPGTQIMELVDLAKKHLGPVVTAVEKVVDEGEVSFDQVIEYLRLSNTMRRTMQAIAAAHPDNKPKRTPARKSGTPKGAK